MAETFYPFVGASQDRTAEHDARIAVYDSPSTTPRVLVVPAGEIRAYLEELTQTVYTLAREQGGKLPFAIIREIVENYIHASFKEPAITIIDGGNTIRFADQGPGIADKERAVEFGTTSATDEMKAYIRGVGSGLPIARQYLLENGGSLTIDDNLSTGTIVTISTHKNPTSEPESSAPEVGERGRQIIEYLERNEWVGPSDMVREHGGSQPTWSRELVRLEDMGLLEKVGQERGLTEKGSSLTN